jgi:hypothetical protein
MVNRHVARSRTANRVTTTRTTTVREGIVPTVVAPPAYSEVVREPRYYDVVTPGSAAPQPFVDAASVAAGTAAPAYRYVYEPDRILVIDPYTNIAVQAIPR